MLDHWANREGIGWANELEPLYEAAEEVLAVTALDPEEIGRNGQLCMEGAQAVGASGGPISRNAGACVQCSSCPLGCRLDAKRAAHVSYLPRAVKAGARVRAGVQVQRVLTENGRATGLACRAGLPTTASEDARRKGRPAAGRDWEVRAKAVVSAAGAFGTPELLMRSGISHPALGRHLHIHPAAWIGARYPEEVRGWEGVMQSYYVDQWAPEGILLEATFTPLSFGAQWLPGVGTAFSDRVANFDHIASIGVHLHDRSEGRVGLTSNGSLRLSYRLLAEEARTIQFGIARAAEIHFAAGATEVYPNVGPIPVIEYGRLPEFEAKRLKPADLRLEAFHPMSTARMGADPAANVCDPDGAIRGTVGLYVADASLLPTSVGVNPMMTIIACSAHVARGSRRGSRADRCFINGQHKRRPQTPSPDLPPPDLRFLHPEVAADRDAHRRDQAEPGADRRVHSVGRRIDQPEEHANDRGDAEAGGHRDPGRRVADREPSENDGGD